MMLLTIALTLWTVIEAQQMCGQTPVMPNTDTKVVGGSSAVPFSWPWHAQFCQAEHDWSTDCGYQCGAVIIGSKWVLTAGHCVYGDNTPVGNHRVKAGIFNEDTRGEQQIPVKSMILHPNFDMNRGYPLYDVALLELASELSWNDHTQPVCLPATDGNVLQEPTVAWMSGWGLTDENGNTLSRPLKQAPLPMVNDLTCQAIYQSHLNARVMVCAGGRSDGPCGGDSGGPLVINRNGTWWQYGAVSWGHGCGQPGYPAVFSRVTSYCDFISSTTSRQVQCQ